MARPTKEGLEYWPIDCGFFRDRKIKLLKKEFGVTGVYLVLLMLNKIYEENGYYTIWDDDECALMSDECGLEDQKVNEVVKGCLRRSVFDNGVFQVFGVLTSRGIQKRYLNAVGHNRTQIIFIEEYFLLDKCNEKEVPKNTLGKVALKSVKTGETISLKEFPRGIPGKTNEEEPYTLGKHHKGKESKEKERKEDDRETPGENKAGPSSSLPKTPEQEKLSKIFTHYTDMIYWQMSPMTIEKLKDFAQRMDADLITRSFDIAIEHGHKEWGYINGILSNWDKAKIYTLQEMERHESDRSRTRDIKQDADPYAKEADPTGGYFTL